MKAKVFLLLLWLLPNVSFAAVEFFLEIPGIAGESTTEGHENEIVVSTWTWGTSTNGRLFCIEDLIVTKVVDLSTPGLLRAQIKHTAFGSTGMPVVLTARKVGGESTLDFFKLQLEDVTVDAITSGGASGDGSLMETVRLHFESVLMTYTPINDDGSSGPETIPVGYSGSVCR